MTAHADDTYQAREARERAALEWFDANPPRWSDDCDAPPDSAPAFGEARPSPEPMPAPEPMPPMPASPTFRERLEVAQAEPADANVRRFLRFRGASYPLELQALDVPDGRYSVNRFAHARTEDEAVRLATEAERWGAPGVFLLFNIIAPAVATRAKAGEWHAARKGESTTDADVTHRPLLFVDVDAVRSRGTSADAAELAAALDAGERSYQRLVGLVGEDAIGVGHSGNGCGLYLALDTLPASDDLTALVKEILAALGKLHDSAAAHVDPSVCDAKRLCPAFGTTKRKGAAGVTERPHRRTAFVAPETVRRLTMLELVQLRDALRAELPPEPEKTPKATPKASAATAERATEGDGTAPDPFKACNALRVERVLEWLDLGTAEQPTCPGCGAADGSAVAIVENGVRCMHGSCNGRGVPGAKTGAFYTPVDVVAQKRSVEPIAAVRAMNDHFTLGLQLGPQPTKGSKARKTKAQPAATEGLPPGVLPTTDLATAHRLLAAHGADIRHSRTLGWVAWGGPRWIRDDVGAVERMAHSSAAALAVEAAEAFKRGEIDKSKLLYAWATKAQARPAIVATLAVAQSLDGIASTPDAFDRDPWLLNTQSGTVDLRTGQLRAHRRDDMLTTLAPVAFDPGARCPEWEGALLRTFAGDVELVAFVQRAIGYSLTGDTSEQCFFVLHGEGSNGKSTLLEVLRDLLGDYCAHTPTDTLMVSKHGRGTENDVAALRGVRMVTAIESGKARTLDEERIKHLTGGDTVAARFLFKEWFQFRPAFKVWLACNDKPTITGTDHAMWRRVRLVPFDVTFTRDETLPGRLRAEGPGILAWAVRGCLDWQRGGLRPPARVLAATEGYRADSDTVARFVGEECVVQHGLQVAVGALYERYATWCKTQGEACQPSKQFGLAIAKDPRFRAGRTKLVRFWAGLGLPAESDDGGRYGDR